MRIVKWEFENVRIQAYHYEGELSSLVKESSNNFESLDKKLDSKSDSVMESETSVVVSSVEKSKNQLSTIVANLKGMFNCIAMKLSSTLRYIQLELHCNGLRLFFPVRLIHMHTHVT